MSEPKHRLMQAITEAGYEGPTDAWRANRRALGISKDLMISNTNGNRPISRQSAKKYAEVFGHTAGWYLYGNETDYSAVVERSTADAAPEVTAQLSHVFSDLVKSDIAVQRRALKLLRSTVYGPSKSRAISTNESS